jgi:diguanylate cyclase (GGDEF)-like protein
LSFRVLLVVLVPMIALQYLTFRDARDERRKTQSATLVGQRLDVLHHTANLIVPMTVEVTVEAGVAHGEALDADRADIDTMAAPTVPSFLALRSKAVETLDSELTILDDAGVDVSTVRDLLAPLRAQWDADGDLDPRLIEKSWGDLRAEIVRLNESAAGNLRQVASTADLLSIGAESEQMVAVLQYASDGLWHTMMAGVSGEPHEHLMHVTDSEGALTASLDRFEQVLPDDRRADLVTLRQSESFTTLDAARTQFFDTVIGAQDTAPYVVTDPQDVALVIGTIGVTMQRLDAIQLFGHDFFDDEMDIADAIRSDASRGRWIAVGIMALTALVSLVLLVLLMRSILRPLSRLMRQSRKVQKGDLSVEPVKPSGPTDLRVVTRAFNDMVSTLQSYESQLDRLARGETKLEQPLPGPLGDTVRRSVSQLASVTAQLHASEAAANLQARTDSLTGLANRTAALERLAIIAMQARQNEQPGAIIFLDLDGFKSVNDTQGHAEGDRILVEISDRVRDLCPGEMVARIGGDEFLVLVEHAHSLDAVTRKAHDLITVISKPVTGTSGQLFTLSASAGVSLIDGHRDPLSCIAQADTAVYHAKERGRGRVEAYDARLAQVIEDRAEIALTMRHGLAERQFSLRLQPIIDVATLHPIGAEVLLRWHRPGLDEIGPAEFIPIAEQTGVIVDIETWVLEQAVGILRDWRIDPVTAGMRLAVNVSGRHIVEGNLAPLLDELCTRAQVDPGLLDLEITETHLMSDVYRSIVVVDELRAQGMNVAIDDFGTGYSSMSYLHRLTVDALKIDQVFVSGMVDDHLDRTIVELLLRLGDSLGLKVIAEGVDSEQKLTLLRQLGCPWAQGFHIARPMSIDDATRWLKRQHALAASMA